MSRAKAEMQISVMLLKEKMRIFNQVLYQSLFVKGMTLGQALTAARQSVTDNDVRNSYVLFGDPTQRFSLVLR